MISILLIASMPFIASPLEALNVTNDTSLADSNGSFWGEFPFDWAGMSVSGVGDVNGDGYDDFIIGANGNDHGGDRAGQTYLILGKAIGWSMDVNISNADASFTGNGARVTSGFEVSGVGDVNGDEYNDFIIGSHGDDEGAEDAGQTYLIFGRASGWAMDTNLTEANASFLGEEKDDRSGYTISGAGDVNGDGFDDFLIASHNNGDGGVSAGQVYLIMGKATGWAMDTDLSNADASFLGETRGNYAGWGLSGAGDVNGDGYDDFIIGAYYNDEGANNGGQTYLILGKSKGWRMDTDLSFADASFLGEHSNDVSGWTVSGAGDVNGDDYDDFLIGAQRCSDGGTYAGQTYLILGRAKGWSMDSGLSNANASFWGEAKLDSSGFALSDAGDVNGDGFDDFMIGAYVNQEAGIQTGQTYLILGKARGWSMDTNLSKADASFLGEGPGGWSGYAISGAGDANGDGFDDILIAARNDGANGGQSGQTYLIFPDTNIQLTSVKSLRLFSDDTFTKQISWAKVSDSVHVQLMGTGGNTSRADVTEVVVTSDVTSPIGFKLRLNETGINTGVYEGELTLANRSHDGYGWIGTEVGETVNVTSVVDTGVQASLYVTARPDFSKLPTQFEPKEDTAFNYTFILAEGIATRWDVEIEGLWLSWNVSNQTLWGTPSNLDVGPGWVRVNVSDDYGNSNEVNITINVINTPPIIIGVPPSTAVEDEPWYFDFDSSDDGQGDIRWHLDSNSAGIALNSTTGILSWTPFNEDVGTWWVDISVDDDNDGWDRINFTIVVQNTGDGPIILTQYLPNATEDIEYSFTMEASDPDVDDPLTWSLDTDESWLDIDSESGLLQGTPSNDDVGEHWLDVRVVDSYGLDATARLIVQVANVNDRPLITTEDVISTMEDLEYQVEYEAIDPDIGNVLAWSLETLARWLNLDESTGVLSGTPTHDYIGIWPVNITVYDGVGGRDSHEFNIEIIEVNDPPEILTELPPSIEVFEDHVYTIDLYATDEEDGDVAWSDDTDLFDISPGLGIITFTPSQSEVGEWWVNITATDSGGTLCRTSTTRPSSIPLLPRTAGCTSMALRSSW